MLNWALRYLPIVEELNKLPAHYVLDVGSGEHGISKWLTTSSVVQTDISLSRTPNCKNAVGLRADSTKLPFVDHGFDVTTSVDLFEHLTPSARTATLVEIARVTRSHLFIAFPCGPPADRADELLERWLRFCRRPVPPWLREHRDFPYPTEETIFGAVPAGWRVAGTWLDDGLRVHTALTILEHTPLIHRFVSRYPVALLPKWLLRPVPSNGYRRVFHLDRTNHSA